jgi:hypothetical protein
MALPLILAAAGVVGNVISGIGASRQRRKAEVSSRNYDRQLQALESSRQQIINPYSGVTDLSSTISNPFQNLQVATQAAEMQAAETDISLAGTLDTLRQTGAGAGGATALAQAAARSKQGIAASIEQQEARNAELRAQGEAQLQQMRMSEAQRLQQADVAGQQFMFSTREEREVQKLDRLQGMSDRFATQAAQYGQAASSAFGSAASGLTGMGLSMYGNKNTTT